MFGHSINVSSKPIGSKCVIDVFGVVRTPEDSNLIKEEIESKLDSFDKFVINIHDSFTFPATTLGGCLRLMREQNIKIEICYGDTQLLHLFDALRLVEQFNVQKIGQYGGAT